MNLNIEVDFDLADRITIANLKNIYEGTLRELEVFEKVKEKKKLEEWQEVDYERSLKVRKHVKKVLCYLMTREEIKEYFGE